MESILARLKQDHSLKQQVLKLLPKNLGVHCEYCSIKGHQLIIYTRSAVWASRLFYHRSQILDGLKNSGCDPIRSVKACVLSPQAASPQKFTKSAKPGLAHLIEQSGQLMSDQDLKQSLLKLARVLKDPNS